MHFADIVSASHARRAEKSRNAILRNFGLREGKIELLVLSNLSDVELPSVYGLWKNLPTYAHYTTILRVLKRLEEKGLVKLAFSRKEGRHLKKYTATSWGRLIAALAKGGWKAAARVAAEESSRFKECVLAHQSLNPYYYLGLTRNVISDWTTRTKVEKFQEFDEQYRGKFGPTKTKELYSSWYKRKREQLNIDDLVMQNEYNHIQDYFLNYFDGDSLPATLKEMKILSQVGWIKTIVMSVIDEYLDEQKRCIDRCIKLRNGLVSAEEKIKLTRFLDNSKLKMHTKSKSPCVGMHA